MVSKTRHESKMSKTGRPQRAVSEEASRLVERQDLINIAILTAVALVIGVYLIATTVLIARDGTEYIEYAKSISNGSVGDVRDMQQPPGYPFLIYLMHKVTGLFNDTESIQGWIISAQLVSLLSKVIASVALYFVGSYFVGPRISFWGVVILSILPDSAAFGSDALPEWPHVMFLSTGFLLLLLGAQYRKNWMFGWAGIIAGLGYLVRSESCQLILYGSAWLLFNLVRPQGKMKRTKAAGALILLLAGFAVIAVPYMRFKGYVFPDQVMWKLSAFLSFSNNSYNPVINANICLAGLSIKGVIGNETLITNMCETLVYYFVPALLIGCYYYFRKQSKTMKQTFFAAAFVILNVAMLCWQSNRFLSRRHTLALVAFTIFYIPIGLHTIACWLSERSPKNNVSMQKNRQQWFLVLLVIGMAICLPKLLRPMRIDKQGYLDAAKWLKENTKPEDIIVVPDGRIAFYAQREAKKMQMGTNTISGGRITSESWYHLAGTYDGKYQKLYINGKLVSSTEPGLGLLNAGRDDLAIGKPYKGQKSYFNGSIRDVRIYSEALSGDDIEALCNQQIPEVKDGELIGYWPLEGDTPDVNALSGSGMAFDGIKDYIELSGFGTRFNAGKLTVSASVKPKILKEMNWILGNKAHFRIGVRNPKVYFWIQERSPGHTIPAEVSYVIRLASETTSELNARFNKNVQKKYSVWADKRKKKKRIVIYEVL